jgi:hypothetical protein
LLLYLFMQFIPFDCQNNTLTRTLKQPNAISTTMT